MQKSQGMQIAPKFLKIIKSSELTFCSLEQEFKPTGYTCSNKIQNRSEALNLIHKSTLPLVRCILPDKLTLILSMMKLCCLKT